METNEWTLIRHKASYPHNSDKPAAIYWCRPRDGKPGFEIRTPVNAAGFGSEDEGEILPPDRSAHSGVLPVDVLDEFYVYTTPEGLGLELTPNA